MVGLPNNMYEQVTGQNTLTESDQEVNNSAHQMGQIAGMLTPAPSTPAPNFSATSSPVINSTVNVPWVSASGVVNSNSADGMFQNLPSFKIRQTNDGKKAIRVTRPSGRVKDISPNRVKEFIPNPRNPRTGLDQVNFKKAGTPKGTKPLPGNRSKRTLTRKEQKLIDKINQK